MPLNDRFNCVLLTPLGGGLGGVNADTLRFIPKLRPAGAWDEAEIESLLFLEDGAGEEAVLQQTGMMFDTLGPEEGSRWWMADAPTIEQRAPGVHIVRAQLKGLITPPVDEEPPRYGYRIRGRTDTQNASPATINGVYHEKAETDEDALELEVNWCHIGTRPDVSGVGTETAPPIPVTVRPSFWNSLADPTYHYPNGWVLVSRDPEPVVQGTENGWLVHDLYQFRYALTP